MLDRVVSFPENRSGVLLSVPVSGKWFSLRMVKVEQVLDESHMPGICLESANRILCGIVRK